MLDRIRTFFDTTISSAARDDSRACDHKRQLAAAALMIEVLKSDFEYRDEEWDTIREALLQDLALQPQEVDEIIALAEQEVDQAVSLQGFTRCINDNYTLEEKVELMEMLWRIAWADDVLSAHERHLMRKISSLLYIPHKEYIGAKLRAKHGHRGPE